MAANKTTETENNVADYVATIGNAKRRSDCSELVCLLTQWTGFEPKLWGTSIVGFGTYHYRYESGREGDAPLIGLSARANAITLYLASSFDQKEQLLQQVGKHKTSKGCLYIQKLDDINIDVLSKMVHNSVDQLKRIYS